MVWNQRNTSLLSLILLILNFVFEQGVNYSDFSIRISLPHNTCVPESETHAVHCNVMILLLQGSRLTCFLGSSSWLSPPSPLPPSLACVQLLGPGILPHHCNLMHTEGMVTVTPHGPDADTFVDGQRVTETTVLRSGSTLQFGSAHVFKFVDPMFDQGGKREPAALMRGRHKSGWVASRKRERERLLFPLIFLF